MDPTKLSGKAALVGGSSRSIGRAIAIELAKAGADVAVNYLAHGDEANAVSEEIKHLGRSSISIEADVSIASEVSRLVKSGESLGPVSVLVNDAGIANAMKFYACR